MATILIVDDDLVLQKVLGRSLEKHKDDFETLFASNGEEAVRILEHQPIDLLVTDIIMPRMDGFALLSHMSANYPIVPCIVLTSYTIPGLERKLSDSIFRFLKKPVAPADLANLIMKVLEQAAGDGALSGVSVPGLMQIIEAEEKTCLLVIRADGKKMGAMYFHRGVLYDAVCGGLQGEEAALQLIGLDNTQLEYRKLPPKNIPKRIEIGIQALVFETMRRKDEQAVAGSAEPENELLTEGIHLCEGLHLQKAQKIFLKIVSRDAKNMRAWLWLSRTVSNMKQLRIALTKAYKLEPKDLDVARDIRMFSAAAKMGLEQIRRCPFCYAPIPVKAADCHFCGATLVLNAETLLRIEEKANRSELRLALDRFEEVLVRELNISVLFYAALACLHLGELDAALEYFEQQQRCVQCVKPEKSSYTATVERILAFVASRRSVEEFDNEPGREAQTPVEPEGPAQKKVLVVEDSPTTRRVIKMTLLRNDFNVIEAEDGVEALTKINDEQPDLILLDVMLPKLDGYGILSVLKQNSVQKKVPVIMLTSKDGLKDRIKGRFSSASAYLTKPFNPDVLIEKVNQYI